MPVNHPVRVGVVLRNTVHEFQDKMDGFAVRAVGFSSRINDDHAAGVFPVADLEMLTSDVRGGAISVGQRVAHMVGMLREADLDPAEVYAIDYAIRDAVQPLRDGLRDFRAEGQKALSSNILTQPIKGHEQLPALVEHSVEGLHIVVDMLDQLPHTSKVALDDFLVSSVLPENLGDTSGYSAYLDILR